MAEIERGNWSFKDPSEQEIPPGSTIAGGNFTQASPDTPIMVGRSLTITGGNFSNVRQDAAWTILGGNWTQISRCANLHPTWVAKGRIAAEPENCPHVVDTDEVVVDGEVLGTFYHYKDTVQ